MLRPTLLWCLAAVAGVVLAAGIAYAASGLARAPIGLSSEPLSAGQGLAPKPTAAATAAPKPKRKRTKPKPAATTTPSPAPVATAAPTVDDHGSGIEPGDDSGGHGGNRGKGGG